MYAPIGALILSILSTVYLFRLSLWTDEASSVWLARMSIVELFTALCDPHPPGYYLLLHLWLWVGESAWWLRLLSLLASLGSCAVVYRWGKMWLGRSVGQWALVLLCLQPLQVWYSAEIRMYTTAQFIALLAAYIAWQMWQPASSSRLLGGAYWLAATAALWTDYTAVFSLGMLQLLWIALGMPQWKRWIALQLAVGLPTGAAWLASGQLVALGDSYQPVLVATRADQLGVGLSVSDAALLLQVIAALAAIAAVALAFKWRLVVQRIGTTPVAAILLVGWTLLLVLAAVPSLFTLKRLLMGLLPWGALLAAWAINVSSRRVQMAAPILLIVAVGLMLGTHQKTVWRTTIEDRLPAQVADEDAVVWVDELAATAFEYYDAEPLAWEMVGVASAVPASLAAEPPTIVFVSDDNRYRDAAYFLPNALFEEYALVSDSTSLEGVRLMVFERGISAETNPEFTPPLADFPSPFAQCRINP